MKMMPKDEKNINIGNRPFGYRLLFILFFVLLLLWGFSYTSNKKVSGSGTQGNGNSDEDNSGGASDAGAGGIRQVYGAKRGNQTGTGKNSLGFRMDTPHLLDSYVIKVWDKESGLPTNAIIAITRTKDGYLWIGTQAGLVRFDGAAFDIYNSENTPQIITAHIRAIAQDHHGALWIGMIEGGLLRFYNGKFTSFTTRDGLSHNSIQVITVSRSGDIWIGTDNGLNRFRYEKGCDELRDTHNYVDHNSDCRGKLSMIELPSTLPSRKVVSFLEVSKGQFYVATKSDEIVKLTEKEEGFEYESVKLPGSTIEVALLARDGTLWVGTAENGLFSIRGNERLHLDTNNGLTNNHVFNLFEDKERNIWVGTFGGGVIRIRDYKISVLSAEKRLSSNLVSCFYEDPEGNLWIGTNSGGLNQLKKKRVTSFTPSAGVSHDFYGLYLDSLGNIWLGSMGFGVSRFKDGEFKRFTKKDGFLSDNIISITEDAEGGLWFATYGSGVTRVKNGKYNHYSFPETDMGNFLRSTYTDSRKNIWVGSDAGCIYRLNASALDSGKFELMHRFESPIITILEDRNGDFWFGTNENGVYYYPKKGNPIHYRQSNGLTGNAISTVYEDKKHRMWVGTDFNGLNVIANGKIMPLRKINGLPENGIWGVIEDDFGNFWITSNRGVCRISLQDMESFLMGKSDRIHPIEFGKDEGMADSECTGGVQSNCLRNPDGKLWFPSTAGLNLFDPGNISLNKIPPPVTIKKVLLNNESCNTEKPVTIPPGVRHLEIHYTALSFQLPKSIQFKYKMEGFDSEWINAGARRTAYYTSLPYGEYKFRVIACNNDGIWNEAGAVLQFHVGKFFYQYVSFYLIIGVIILLGTFGLFKLSIRNRKRREKELMAIVEQCTVELIEANFVMAKANEAKGELLHIVAHDFRNKLQIILGYADLIESYKDCPPAIMQNIGEIFKSANQMKERIDDTLQHSEINSTEIKLKKETLNVSELSSQIVSAYRTIAHKKEQNILASIEDNIVISADKGRLKEVLENLLSNAIKYSPFKKSIQFSLRKKAEKLLIEVTDEGPGFSTLDLLNIFKKYQKLSAVPTGGEASTGLGLAITRQMVEMHSGTITVESELGKGSRFIVELPLA